MKNILKEELKEEVEKGRLEENQQTSDDGWPKN